MAAFADALAIFNATDAAGVTVQLDEWGAHVETDIFAFNDRIT